MDFKDLQLREGDGGCTLSLKVIPKSSRNQITGVEAGALRIKIQAPPVDGAANEAVIEYLAGILKKPKSSLSVMKGQLSRHKLVKIKGVQAKDVLEALTKYKS